MSWTEKFNKPIAAAALAASGVAAQAAPPNPIEADVKKVVQSAVTECGKTSSTGRLADYAQVDNRGNVARMDEGVVVTTNYKDQMSVIEAKLPCKTPVSEKALATAITSVSSGCRVDEKSTYKFKNAAGQEVVISCQGNSTKSR